MKTSVRNTSPGIRGLNTVDGYRDLAPGEFVESVELTDDEHKNADRTGYFVFGAKAKTAETAAPAGAAAAPVVPPTTAGELPNNVPKLKKIARDEGIDVGTAKSAAELKAAITAGRAAAAAPALTTTPGPGDDLDNMADDDLRNTVAAITGKPAPDGADRETLLKLARGEA